MLFANAAGLLLSPLYAKVLRDAWSCRYRWRYDVTVKENTGVRLVPSVCTSNVSVPLICGKEIANLIGVSFEKQRRIVALLFIPKRERVLIKVSRCYIFGQSNLCDNDVAAISRFQFRMVANTFLISHRQQIANEKTYKMYEL